MDILRAKFGPILREEDDLGGSKQFLQGPSTGEPSASFKWRAWPIEITDRDIGEVCITDLRLFIICEHGINGFIQFRSVSFVNTTAVNPDISQAILFRTLARIPHLLPCRLPRRGVVLKVIEYDLVSLPGMRKDCIWWDFMWRIEDHNLEGGNFQKAHLKGKDNNKAETTLHRQQWEFFVLHTTFIYLLTGRRIVYHLFPDAQEQFLASIQV